MSKDHRIRQYSFVDCGLYPRGPSMTFSRYLYPTNAISLFPHPKLSLVKLKHLTLAKLRDLPEWFTSFRDLHYQASLILKLPSPIPTHTATKIDSNTHRDVGSTEPTLVRIAAVSAFIEGSFSSTESNLDASPPSNRRVCRVSRWVGM